MVCPFCGHSPSNSTGDAYPRSVPSRPAPHVRVVSPIPSRKSPNRSTRCERVVSESPRSPTLGDQLVGLCVGLPADHAPRRRRSLWAYRCLKPNYGVVSAWWVCSVALIRERRSAVAGLDDSISATIRPVRVRPQLQGAECRAHERLQSRVQVRRPRIRVVWIGDILAASPARREALARDQTVALRSARNSPSCPHADSTRASHPSVRSVGWLVNSSCSKRIAVMQVTGKTKRGLQAMNHTHDVPGNP
jgi:hypothetical protein